MSPARPDRNQPRPPLPGGRSPAQGSGGEQNWRWLWTVLIVVILAVLVLPSLIPHTNAKSISYATYMNEVRAHGVVTATIDNGNGVITGRLKDGTQYTTQGPNPPLAGDVKTMRNDGVSVDFSAPSSSLLASLAPYLFIALFFGLLLWLFGRQARGRCRGSCPSAARVLGCTARSDPRPPSTTLPATTGSSRRSARSWTSSRPRAGSVTSAPRSPRASCWSGPPGQGRPCSLGRSPGKPASRSSPSPDPTSWRCSWASGRAACATSSRPRVSRRPPSSSSTRSTPSAGSEARGSEAATTSESRP